MSVQRAELDEEVPHQGRFIETGLQHTENTLIGWEVIYCMIGCSISIQTKTAAEAAKYKYKYEELSPFEWCKWLANRECRSLISPDTLALNTAAPTYFTILYWGGETKGGGHDSSESQSQLCVLEKILLLHPSICISCIQLHPQARFTVQHDTGCIGVVF